MSGWTIPLQRLTEKAKGDLATVVRKATLDAFTRVVLKSPVDTGRYKESWFALADGKLITDLSNPPEAQEYAITNDQPYSRVIEIGKKGKGKKFRAGVHVADKTTKAMMTRFGNSIQARTMFLDLAASGSGRADTVPWITKRGARVNYPSVVMRAL